MGHFRGLINSLYYYSGWYLNVSSTTTFLIQFVLIGAESRYSRKMRFKYQGERNSYRRNKWIDTKRRQNYWNKNWYIEKGSEINPYLRQWIMVCYRQEQEQIGTKEMKFLRWIENKRIARTRNTRIRTQLNITSIERIIGEITNVFRSCTQNRRPENKDNLCGSFRGRPHKRAAVLKLQLKSVGYGKKERKWIRENTT